MPDLFAAAYGQPDCRRVGFRAVDQFGVEWFRDWEGANDDRYGGAHLWVRADGQKGWQADRTGRPLFTSEGFIVDEEETP